MSLRESHSQAPSEVNNISSTSFDGAVLKGSLYSQCSGGSIKLTFRTGIVIAGPALHPLRTILKGKHVL